MLAELHRGLAPTGDDYRPLRARRPLLPARRAHAAIAPTFWRRPCTPTRSSFRAPATRPACTRPTRASGSRTTSTTRASPRVSPRPHRKEAEHQSGGGGQRGKNAEVRLEAGVRPLPFGKLDLTLDEAGLTWAGYPLEHFISTTTLSVRGLRNRYLRPGLGAPLAASLADAADAKKPVGAERIGARTKVPVTALVRLENVRASLATGQLRGRLELYAADRCVDRDDRRPTPTTRVRPERRARLPARGQPALRPRDRAHSSAAALFSRMLPRDRTQDGLFTLQPYVRGKIPVVLVHGTASSPTRWAELVNELEADPMIRDRFQIWIFMYDTGNPIGYSAGRLRASPHGRGPPVRPRGHGSGAAAHGGDRAQPGRSAHQADRDRHRHAPLGPLEQEVVRLGDARARDPRPPAAVDVLHAPPLREARRLHLDPAPWRHDGRWRTRRLRRFAGADAGHLARPARAWRRPRSTTTPGSPRCCAGRRRRSTT